MYSDDCVPASAIGAPHQRDRVWIVVHDTDAECLQSGERHIPSGERRRADEAEQARLGAGVWPLTHTSSAHDGRSDGGAQGGQECEPGDRSSTPTSADANREQWWGRTGREDRTQIGDGAQCASDPTRDGCRQGRLRRPADSFAWIRDATRWHAGHAYREGLAERKGEPCDARQECEAAERAAIGDVWKSEWPCESAILGVDDGVAFRVERTAAIGDALVPQIPELIGRAIIAAEASAARLAP